MRHLQRIVVLAIGLGAALAARSARAQGLPAGYAGSSECLDCHKKDITHFTETGHGKLFLQHPRDSLEALGCEACHGPGKEHAESGGDVRGALIAFGKKQPAPVETQNAVCLQCHEKTARLLWEGSTHEMRNVACTKCHTLMQTNSERGNLKLATVRETCGTCHTRQKNAALRASHMPLGENKLECTSCHNPHGSPNPRLLLASSTNETCYSCHAEKRGPFLWEHAPVVENCANCHDPHGSNHEKMLKVSRPRLCQQCHQGTGHPQQPRRVVTLANGAVTAVPSDVQFLLNRQCSNCHFNIHGSNHPSGQAFTR
jgi:DmsE family decaheme c-type cytochrome